MADHFFDVKRDRPGTGTNPCSDSYDGAGDWPLTVSLCHRRSGWKKNIRPSHQRCTRLILINVRHLSVAGGTRNLEVSIRQQLRRLDYWIVVQLRALVITRLPILDRVDTGEANATAYTGATTGNYFKITEDQAENHENAVIIDPTFDSAITTPSPFGYLMYYGVLADGDIGNLSQGVYMDEDGDPATEGDLFAWWDGNEYRWGADPTYDGNIDEDAFTVVPRELLVEWSMFPLQEAPDENGDFPAGPLYEIGVMDDLAGLNVDTFVYLGRTFTGNQFTVRLTATSVDAAGITAGAEGNDVPAWDPLVGTPAPELTTFINNDGVIIIRAGIAGEPLIINLADIVTGELPTAVVENLDTGETENVTLLQDADNPKMFSVSLPTAANGGAGSNNDGTMNVWPEQTVRVSYTDVITEAAPDGSDPQIRTDEVVIPFEQLEPTPPPASDDDGGCSCSTNPDGSVDPILPAAVLFALGYLGLRRWESKRKQEK